MQWLGADLNQWWQRYLVLYDVTGPQCVNRWQGLTLSIWFTCPSGTWFWKWTCPAKIFMCPANICTSPVKLMYAYCWENKYMRWLKNHLPSLAHNQKSLCALGQDLHVPGMRPHLNVKPWLILYICGQNLVIIVPADALAKPWAKGITEFSRSLGAVSIRKTVLPGMAIPMLKIRRPNGRLIFNMEIAIRR